MTCSATSSATSDLGLGRGRPEMWRQERVGRLEQRRVDRRLRIEDIEPGPTEVTGPERLGDGRFVDDPAPGDIEDDRPGTEPRDRLAAQQSAGRARQRDVDGHDVGAVEQLVERHEFDAVVGGLPQRGRTDRPR